MEKKDIPFLSVAELSELIHRKEVSPVEATESYLERIDDLNFKFNSYLTVCRKEALQAAQEAEQAIAQGNYLGPMHGVPVAVKDQLWTKGIRTTVGSRLMADFFPEEDATAVANLKRAGAILLGKTSLTEFAIGGSERYGPSRNPWNLDMITGGSGSGSATAAFLCATAGYDPKDPYSWDVPVPDYRRALDGDIKGIRVGAVKELIHSEIVDNEVRDGIIKAGTVLAELGATVEEVSLPRTIHGGIIFGALANVESVTTYRDWIRDRLHEFGHGNQLGLLVGSILPAQAYYKAQKLRELVRRQVQEALETYDVLILPTSKSCAPRLEDDPVITSKEMVAGMTLVMTRPFNLANSPALSINCGFNSQGLPIGLQIGGRPFAEETVLKVAHAYEQNTPWHTLKPPDA